MPHLDAPVRKRRESDHHERGAPGEIEAVNDRDGIVLCGGTRTSWSVARSVSNLRAQRPEDQGLGNRPRTGIVDPLVFRCVPDLTSMWCRLPASLAPEHPGTALHQRLSHRLSTGIERSEATESFRCTFLIPSSRGIKTTSPFEYLFQGLQVTSELTGSHPG